MPTNREAAEALSAIADLLDVLGERFKPDAYRRAARSIESLTEDLSAVAGRHELRSIPGVGEAIEEKLRELLATGHVEYLERLRRDVPRGVAELLRVPGLGPKTARRFWTDLGVDGPDALRAAIDARRLEGVKGFGPRKIVQLRNALLAYGKSGSSTRLPLEKAYPIARRIARALREDAGADRVEIAGSFRRGRETVGDLDVLVTSRDPGRAFDTFTALPEVREVRLRGGTKETAILEGGLQVDVRVVDPSSFGAALQYFTGSKEHNVLVRTLARDAGLRVNEYGVFRGEDRVAGASEEEVYAALGLAWIPPELREGRGEVETARLGPLPALVEAGDLRGDLHVHVPVDAGPESVDRILDDARGRGWAYLGIVAEWVDADGEPFRLGAEILARALGGSTDRFRVFRVAEVDAAGAAPGQGPSGVDLVVVRPTRAHPHAPGASNEARPPIVVVHLGAGAPDASATVRAWIAFAGRTGAAVEVGPGEDRLDSTWARHAREQGVRLAVPTGVGGGADDPLGPVAIAFARRAGAVPGEVANATRRPESGSKR